MRLINASSGQDATSVTGNSDLGEPIRVIAPFENVSERNRTLPLLKVNDMTRNNIPDDVSEFSVAGTHFDRQPQHTHHSNVTNSFNNYFFKAVF